MLGFAICNWHVMPGNCAFVSPTFFPQACRGARLYSFCPPARPVLPMGCACCTFCLPYRILACCAESWHALHFKDTCALYTVC